MKKSNTQMIDKMKYLQSCLQSERERMQEALHLISRNWNDPGAEVVKEELSRRGAILDAYIEELQIRTSVSIEKPDGEKERSKWQPAEDWTAED